MQPRLKVHLSKNFNDHVHFSFEHKYEKCYSGMNSGMSMFKNASNLISFNNSGEAMRLKSRDLKIDYTHMKEAIKKLENTSSFLQPP